MKRIVSAAVAALVVAGFHTALEAKTLAEALKEKGVITVEELESVSKKSDPVYYKPGSGITIETENNGFKASIGGRLQVRYTYEDFDDDTGEENLSSFQVRRMKVWLKGHAFSKDLKYKFQQNFGDGNSVTEDAYFTYRIADPLAVTAGQFKAPQGRQELTSSGKQLFVDRSLANETFNLGRDIGVQASGQFRGHLVEYRFGVFNGNGPNRKENIGNDHMFAARLDVNPLGKFKMDEVSWGEKTPLLNIGGSFAWVKLTEADAGNLNADNDVFDKALDIDKFSSADFLGAFGTELSVRQATANLHAKWMGASFGAEYYRMDADPDAGDDFDASGYYVQGGYMILPKTLGLGVRYSAIDSDDVNASETFDKSEFQVGASYYLAKHNAKVDLDYTRVSDDDEDTDTNIVRVQAQLIF